MSEAMTFTRTLTRSIAQRAPSRRLVTRGPAQHDLPPRVNMRAHYRHGPIGIAAGVPLVANMVEGGRTPILSRAELEAFGFKLAIFPTAGFLAAGAALRSLYGEIRSRGSSKAWSGELYPFDDFSSLMGFERVWEFEKEHVEE